MSDYKEFAVELALEAGKKIKTNFIKGVQKEWKKDDTPITVVDIEINTMVIDQIKKRFPEHSILAEEKSDLTKSDYVWVCDPIDGTVPFSHGFPLSTFTLSLTHQGEVVLGVIFDPYLERMAVAEKGKGAFLNNKKIVVSDANNIKNTVIDVETWSTSLYDLTPLFKALTDKGSMVTILRSTVYAGMLVGMGEIGAVLFAGKTAWDAAALKIIVEEAGGTVTDLSGRDQSYNSEINGCIASNGRLHKELVELINLHIPQKPL